MSVLPYSEKARARVCELGNESLDAFIDQLRPASLNSAFANHPAPSGFRPGEKRTKEETTKRFRRRLMAQPPPDRKLEALDWIAMSILWLEYGTQKLDISALVEAFHEGVSERIEAIKHESEDESDELQSEHFEDEANTLVEGIIDAQPMQSYAREDVVEFFQFGPFDDIAKFVAKLDALPTREEIEKASVLDHAPELISDLSSRVDNLERALSSLTVRLRSMRDDMSNLVLDDVIEELQADIKELRTTSAQRVADIAEAFVGIETRINNAKDSVQSVSSSQTKLRDDLKRMDLSIEPLKQHLEELANQLQVLKHESETKDQTATADQSELLHRIEEVEAFVQESPSAQAASLAEAELPSETTRPGEAKALEKARWDGPNSLRPPSDVSLRRIAETRSAIGQSGVSAVSAYLATRLRDCGLSSPDACYAANVAMTSASAGLVTVFSGQLGEYVCAILTESLFKERYELRVSVGETRTRIVDDLIHNRASLPLALFAKDVNLSQPEVLLAGVFGQTRTALIGGQAPRVVCLASLGRGPLHLDLSPEALDYASVIDTDAMSFRKAKPLPTQLVDPGFGWIDELLESEADGTAIEDVVEDLELSSDHLLVTVLNRAYASSFAISNDEASAADVVFSAFLVPRLVSWGQSPEDLSVKLEAAFEQSPETMRVTASVLNKAKMSN